MPSSKLALAISKLEKRSNSIRNELVRFPYAKEFFNKSSLIAYGLRERSSQLLASVGLVGAIITTPIIDITSVVPNVHIGETTLSGKQKILGLLHEVLPHNPTQLSREQASQIEPLLSEALHFNVKSVFEEQSLNHHLGYIGFEQHLKRFPGDNLSEHDGLQEAGMAPGLGAFGYFAKDKSSFTTRDYLREKYYCVVQTLYLENWNKDFKQLKDWYRFRKMIIINPVSGDAVVCSVGDAGPAEWTGKQFGGSPETMQALGLDKGPRKGLILMLFVDDPDNLVPLGPVKY